MRAVGRHSEVSVDDLVSAVAFPAPFDTSEAVTLTGADRSALLGGHVVGVGHPVGNGAAGNNINVAADVVVGAAAAADGARSRWIGQWIGTSAKRGCQARKNECMKEKRTEK